MSLDDDARRELAGLEAVHRLRLPRIVDGRCGPRITLDGVEVLDFASNDYLGLAGDPRLARAASAALETCGVGAGASRLITGNHRAHVDLEQALADWMEVAGGTRSEATEPGMVGVRPPGPNESGVRTFSSGYAANVGVLTALLGPDDVVFSDALNHASIVDGCRLSRARIAVVPHRDLGALEAALEAHPGRRRLVVSETLFSMDGDLADVAALSAICKKHAAALMLDEAHAIGARGPEGRGVAAEAGVVPDLLVGTCGKALGVYGAFVASTPAISALLWNRARSLVFSTALPPMISQVIRASLEIVRGSEGQDRRRILAAHARALRTRVPALGGAADSSIAPLIVADDGAAMELSERALERGVFVQGIRYPTVPANSPRLRVSVSSGHSASDIALVGEILNDATSHEVVR